MEDKKTNQELEVDPYAPEEPIETTSGFFEEILAQKVSEGVLEQVNPDAVAPLPEMTKEQRKDLVKLIRKLRKVQKEKTKDINRIVKKHSESFNSSVLGTYVIEKLGWFAYLTNIDNSEDKIKTMWDQVPFGSKKGDVIDLIDKDNLDDGTPFYMFYLNKQKTIQYKDNKNDR